MTRNKDLKRLVRARMAKTGEAYTSARAAIVARDAPRDVPRDVPRDGPRDAAPRARWPELAGMGDAAVKAKTGRTWAQWVAVLDGAGAWRMSHRDIARHLGDAHGVGSWWRQTVTVGYERIRGLREVGQRRGGGFEANKSRTLPVSAARVFRMFHDARSRRTWLPEGWRRTRTAVAGKSLRADWHDGTRVHVHLVPKGRAKCSVAVQHVGLPDKAAATRAKAAWAERLDALAEALRG